MSNFAANSGESSTDNEQLRREISEKSEIVQSIRKELILSQITVLELQDTVLRKETDKADAIALLGQAELVLESKINYISELDRALNERIATTERQLAETRVAHETIIADLVQKLDQTNRALGDAHNLAANYARESTEARESLAKALNSVQQLQQELRDAHNRCSALSSEKSAIQNELTSVARAKSALEQQLAAIHGSFAWKITAPFRPARDR